MMSLLHDSSSKLRVIGGAQTSYRVPPLDGRKTSSATSRVIALHNVIEHTRVLVEERVEEAEGRLARLCNEFRVVCEWESTEAERKHWQVISKQTQRMPGFRAPRQTMGNASVSNAASTPDKLCVRVQQTNIVFFVRFDLAWRFHSMGPALPSTLAYSLPTSYPMECIYLQHCIFFSPASVGR